MKERRMNMRDVRRSLGFWGITLMFVLCIAPHQTLAADEGSSQMLCAFTRALDCDSDSGCSATTVESLDLPEFMKIDLKKNIATGVAPTAMTVNQKVTQIKTIQRLDGLIILQGIELRGWSAVINEQTGKMSLTISDDDEAFVLFGACVTL
jgi:hypothetical protein